MNLSRSAADPQSFHCARCGTELHADTEAPMAAVRLAAGMAEKATIAPGGTTWPRGFQLPTEHAAYAVVAFRGRTFYAGADDPTEAKAKLASALVDASERWRD